MDIIPPAGFDTCLNSKCSESVNLNSGSMLAYKCKFSVSLSGNNIGIG